MSKRLGCIGAIKLFFVPSELLEFVEENRVRIRRLEQKLSDAKLKNNEVGAKSE